MKKRVYEELKEYTDNEINEIFNRGKVEELLRLPLSAMFHQNWKFTQDVCMNLSKHDHENVRANSILGFTYIARTKGKLEKELIKPILMKELRENLEYRGTIIDAISDINLLMKRKLANKHLMR